MYRHGIVVVALALALAADPIAAAQPSATEAQTIAQTVVANANWVTAAQRCPTVAMQQATATTHEVGENACKPGRLGSCLDACSSGAAGACYWLAHELLRQKVTVDAPGLLYHQACRLGVTSGCTNQAAGKMKAAKDDAATQSCAAATFDLACTRDDPWACTMSAMHLSRGIGVPRDIERALKALDKSCTFGPKDPACTTAIRMRRDIEAQSGASAPEADKRAQP